MPVFRFFAFLVVLKTISPVESPAEAKASSQPSAGPLLPHIISWFPDYCKYPFGADLQIIRRPLNIRVRTA